MNAVTRPWRCSRLTGLLGIAGLVLASCASPALKEYVLTGPPVSAAPKALDAHTTVIEVSRIALPDYLDNEDIAVRRGSVIEKSHLGRWASRLSLGATDLVTARLARGRPNALITAEPHTTKAAYRLVINISRLDVSASGVATLEADWLIVPRDPSVPIRRERSAFSTTGPVVTDGDIVALQQTVLDQLAAAILVKEFP